MAFLELSQLAKRFGSQTVLAELDLTVRDREFLVLVGPSGCGKSTLLRLIAGLEIPTSGRITLDGQDLTNLAPKQRDVAMVFQNYALYPHLSVYENLAFGLRRRQQQAWHERLREVLGRLPGQKYLSASSLALDQQVRQIAGLLQIETLLQRRPTELSGGQKQRVALGRAMVRNPKLYLMDEPLSNLDAQLRTQTRTQIAQWQRKLATTTIYVTHDQIEAMTMGTRIAVMNQGRLQQLDTPLAVYQAPANIFVAGFIGEPQMNFFPAVQQDNCLVGQGFRLPLPLGYHSLPSQVTLGLRPEHLLLDPMDPIWEAQVSLVETLGNETHVLCQAACGPLRLRTKAGVNLAETVQLGADLAGLHLFDRETGQRIPRG